MKEDIIKMAQEAGWEMGDDLSDGFGVRLERFTALVRADEREACAEAFEAEADTWTAWPQAGAAKRKGAAAIRARAEPEQEPVKRTVMYRPADLEALGLTHEDVVKLIKDQS
jgi:hypothetical protein